LGMGEISRREIPGDERVWMEWEEERGVLVGDYYFRLVYKFCQDVCQVINRYRFINLEALVISQLAAILLFETIFLSTMMHETTMLL
jgi:hypothetical protein